MRRKITAVLDHVEHAGAIAVCIQFMLPTIATPGVMLGCVIVVLCIHIVTVSEQI